MRITLPHNTSKENARRILEKKLDELQSQYSGHVNDVDKSWSGDVLAFQVKAKGFTGKGTVEVTDAEIILDGKLPLLAKPFEPRIKSAVEQEAAQLFRKT
jgi:putative polyhydroxyalkanoic acid system protein